MFRLIQSLNRSVQLKNIKSLRPKNCTMQTIDSSMCPIQLVLVPQFVCKAITESMPLIPFSLGVWPENPCQIDLTAYLLILDSIGRTSFINVIKSIILL